MPVLLLLDFSTHDTIPSPLVNLYIITSVLHFGLVTCGLVAGFISYLCTTLRTSGYVTKR